ncbi:MAG: D-glycero-beta-D-manno-heptose 1,7-bisphosphate 7-phosphatase [Gammaproteobacteria bacterium]|nr:MAG: D-glycero-beta-D-manno-heptose 1,7-bisphosphate 7-phosphatase [Gammaproteobacteria bacterium]
MLKQTLPFIILDRDGVINYDSDEYIKSPDEWRPIPGSLDAIAQLNRAGFRVLIATNQSGVARGHYDLDMLSNIHEKLIRELAAHGGYIEEIFFCPHHPEEGCVCRKPKPGLLHQIAEKYGVNLGETFFIGDSHVDIQAAQAAGCKPLLVMTGNGEKVRERHPELFITIPSFADLASAVEFVLLQQGSSHD